MTSNQQKKCNHCGKIKPTADFYENPFSPDGLYSFCKFCFDELTNERPCKKKKEDNRPDPRETGDREPETPTTPEAAKTTEAAEAAEMTPTEAADPIPAKPIEPPAPAPEMEPAPLPEKTLSPVEEFDFIRHLLGTPGAKTRMGFETLQFPKQITKISPRKRICSGCGKVEEIEEVEKNTVVPVHAWFCGLCRSRGVRRRVIKGMAVYDYWGREFTVKKFISRDAVLGFLKNKDHSWDKKPQKIYGSWKS